MIQSSLYARELLWFSSACVRENWYDSVQPVCERICPFLAAFPDNGTIGVGLAVIQSDSPRYTAMHHTALHCMAPYCTTLHRTAPYCTAPHCTTLHHTWPYCTAKHTSTLHSSGLHCTDIHCTAQHSAGIYCIRIRTSGGIYGQIYPFVYSWREWGIFDRISWVDF